MVLRFTCSNGHPLTSPENLAGRVGKCPECGVPIKVPTPSEVRSSAAEGPPPEPPPAISPPSAADAPTANDEATDNEAADNDAPDGAIVFLCPNGHRLHGTRSMEGKAGQCPHCGVKFRVPSSDDPPDEDEPGSQILVGERPAFGELPVQDVAEDAVGPSFNFLLDVSAPRGGVAPPVSIDAMPAAGRHPLCDLFLRLWEERTRGAVVELHLADGATIVPERFARDLSRQGYGVFAVKESDGTHTLTVAAWDSIRRINVRRVGKLPKKMFD
jgi:hypothetical protein